MIRCLLLASAVVSGCKRDDVYDNTLWELAAGAESKNLCSCLYTMERDLEFCNEWVRVSPNIATHKIWEDEKKVRARAAAAGKSFAQFTEDPWGCIYVGG